MNGRTAGSARPHVVVVGGGISGLAAAWALSRDTGVDVTVLEGSANVGGKIAAVRVDGATVDAGAESLLARRPEAVELVEAVGLGADLIHPAVAGSSVWTRDRLRPLPAGQLMGIPGDLKALAASRVLSLRGLARVPLDLALPATPVDADVAVGRYVTARLGREVVDRLVEPLLGGVYAGHADDLSLAATMPALVPALRGGRSLIDAVGQLAPRPNGSAPTPVFASVRGGLHLLPNAVASASGARIRTGSTVRRVEREASGWRLIIGPAKAPEVVTADAVVIAVPAAPASRLLADLVPHAAADLAAIEYASVAIVTFAFAGSTRVLVDSSGPLRGTGFLVPPVEGRTIKAVTYLSRKWGRDGVDPVTVLRASVGRHREEADLQRDDADLAGAVLGDVAAATGISDSPVDVAVTRWGGGLPQYAVGHVQRVERVLRAVQAVPGLAVCGAAYEGVGIAACVASANASATRILESLRARGQWLHG